MVQKYVPKINEREVAYAINGDFNKFKQSAIEKKGELKAQLNQDFNNDSFNYEETNLLMQNLALQNKNLEILSEIEKSASFQSVKEYIDQQNQLESTLCIICNIEKKSVVLMPCRHNKVCTICVDLLRNNQCPYCRGVFNDKIIIYN